MNALTPGDAMPLTMFALGFMAAAWRGLHHNSISWWLGAGFCAAGGLLFSYQAWFFLPALAVVLLASRRWRSRLGGAGFWMAAVPPLVVLGMLLSWNASHDWIHFIRGTWQTALDLQWWRLTGSLWRAAGAASPLGLAVLAGYLFQQFPIWFGSGYAYDAMLNARATDLRAPLWFSALSACLMGYLIGGGVVWAVRILGSLLFGKEAMGLGDVHLMAAVGAVLGWIDATLAFFVAAFVGLAWALLGAVFRGGMLKHLPYGPHLAVATVLVLLCKPLIEMGLSALTGHRVNLP
jgi:prepilin signal peptidase PulO-like enzyme (type II secretory pathway)